MPDDSPSTPYSQSHQSLALISIPGYELREELGRGGMGVVYKAWQVNLKRFVAIKLLPNAQFAGHDALARFLTEAQAVASVKHPNIIDVYDYGHVEGAPYFVMELLEGDPFGKRFLQEAQPNSRELFRTMVKVARGVAEVHAARIIHRDLKPANILFDKRGEPKVADFGLAKQENSKLTRTNEVRGTPYYMAPEQIQGNTRLAGPPADVWALGVILYECVTGRRPFDGESQISLAIAIIQEEAPLPRSVNSKVPAEIEAIIVKCLAKKPAERYPTAKEFADELERYLSRTSAKSSNEQSSKRSFGSGGRISSADLSTPHHRDTPSENRHPLPIGKGDLLNDRYEVREFLGKGGMGAVFSSYDRVRHQEVALKVLLPALTRDVANHKRFIQEATLASGLAHPNIVRVFDLHAAGDLSFLSMELLTEGSTLRQTIEDRKRLQHEFEPSEVLAIAQQLIDGLATAHRSGVIHRDVKPENIWVASQGLHVKLMDFGIARLMKDSQLATTGLALGTAYYMSPEQMRASTEIDHRTDQYAVGVVMYELLTGELPQGAVEKPHEMRPELPVALSEAIMKALASRPENRHADMLAFAKSLQASRKPKLPSRVLARLTMILLAVGGLVAVYPYLAKAVQQFAANRQQEKTNGSDVAPPKVPADELPPDLLADLLPKTAVAYEKAKTIPADVQQLVTDSWNLADRLESKLTTPANELALAKQAYQDRKRVAELFVLDKTLKDLVEQSQLSLKTGESLANDRQRHDEARANLIDAWNKTQTLQQWWRSCLENLKLLDDSRVECDRLSRSPGVLPAALFRWLNTELDRTPTKLFDANPTAAKEFVDSVRKIVAEAQELIPKSRAMKQELVSEANQLPAVPAYDDAKKQLALIGIGLASIETDFEIGNSTKATERFEKAKTDLGKLRGEFPVLNAQMKLQEGESVVANLRKSSELAESDWTAARGAARPAAQARLDNRRRIFELYQKADWVNSALTASQKAIEEGRKLIATDPAAATRRFQSAAEEVAPLLVAEAEIKKHLPTLDTSREQIAQNRSESKPESKLPSEFLSWADAELDKAMDRLALQTNRDPSTILERVDKAVTAASGMISNIAKLDSEARSIGEAIPNGSNFATARNAYNQARKDLSAVRTLVGQNDLSQAERALTSVKLATDRIGAQVAQGHVADAREKLKEFRPAEALLAANRAIGLAPSAEAYTARSFAKHGLHRFREALTDAELAVKANPNSAEAYIARSRANDEVSEFRNALRDGERATELAPNSANAWAALGEAQADNKDLVAAMKSAEKSVELDPQLGIAHRTVGYVHLKKKEYKTAMEHFTKAIEVEPKFATAYNDRGYCQEQLQELGSALRDYSQAISIAPHASSGYLNRANIYVNQEKFRNAIADLDRLIELDYQTGLMHNMRGNAYMKLKLNDEARSDYAMAVKLLPKETIGYINLGHIHNELGDYHEAIRVLNKALDLDENCASALWNRGQAYDKLGNKALAESDRKRAKEIDEKNKKKSDK